MSSVKKRKYTEAEKLAILKACAQRLKNGCSMQLVADWQRIPYGTLDQWVRRYLKEGPSSLKDCTPTRERSTEELNSILSFLSERQRKPTPKQFKWACKHLSVQCKHTTLYVYYRQQVRKQKQCSKT